MGSEVVLPTFSAFLVPYGKLTADNVSGTFVEANPATSAISPDDGTDSSLAFKPSGTPEVGEDIKLRVGRGGIPDGLRGLTLLWRHDDADDWTGWDSWGLITAYELPAWSTSTTLGYQKPDLLALPNGKMILAFDEPIGASRRRVAVRRWNPTTKAWDAASTTVYAEPAANVSEALHPCLCRLPSGRILLFHLKHGGDFSQIWAWYSDDDGATWERGQRDALQLTIDRSSPGAWTLYQMRCAYGRGQISLALAYSYVDGVTEYRVARWASKDAGNRFVLVETLETSDGTGLGHVYCRDQFVVIAMGQTIDGNQWRGGDALSALTPIAGTPSADWNALEGQSMALCVDEQANLIIVSTVGQSTIFFSPDLGDTWAPLHTSSTSNVYEFADDALNVRNSAAQVHRGRICLVGNYGASVTYGIVELSLGGWTTVTHPERSLFDETDDATLAASDIAPERMQVPWGRTWLGFLGDPTGFGWTNADTGAPVYGYTAGYQAVACGAGDVSILDYDLTPGAAYYEVIAEGSLDQSTGTSTIELRSAHNTGGGALTRVLVSVSATAITMTDDVGVGAVGPTSVAGRVDWKAALKGTNAALWVRVHDGSTDRQWTLVGTLSGLTESLGAIVNPRVRRRVSASSVAEWYELRAYLDEAGVIDESLADGQTTATRTGRPAAGIDPMYVADGVSVKVVDGPGFPAESFTMLGGGAKPIELAFPSVAPSPQLYAELTNADDIEIQLDFSATEAEDALNDIIGVYIDGAVYDAQLWGNDGSGDELIATLTTSADVSFTRRGDVLVPVETGSGGTTGYYERHELAGGWACLRPSVDDDVRRIQGNTEGGYDAGAINEKRPAIRLEGIDGTEATSGTVRIVFPRSAHAIPLDGSRSWRYFYLLINQSRASVPAPPWGTVRIRTLAIGSLAVMGWQPARDHVTERQSLTSITETSSGARWARTRNLRTRKIVEFSLSDGVNIGKTRAASERDYIRASDAADAEPVADRHDAPVMLEGLVDELNGPATPVVWFPRFVYDGGAQSWTYGRAGGAVYGRLESAARLESMLGLPHGDQVVRGPRVVLTEEV